MTKPTLFRRLRAVAIIALCIDAASVFFCTVVGKWHTRNTFATDAAYQTHLLTLYCAVALLLPLAAFLAVMCCSRLLNRLGPAVMEVTAISVMIGSLMVVVLSSPANVSSMRGEVFEQVHGYASDSGILMTIDGIITAAHIGLPVRWCVIMPLEVVGVLLYAAIILVIGSPEPSINASFNFIFLFGLIATTSVGKRYAELGERQSFLAIVSERNKRCEAEFRLSQCAPQTGQRRPEDEESAATTTHNSAVLALRGVGAGEDLTEKLDRIADLARLEHWHIPRGDVELLRGEVLGSGGFGVVVEGLMGAMVVAVKIPRHEELHTASSRVLEDVCNELRIFRHLRHPNIIAFFGATIDSQGHEIGLVLERLRGATLHDFILAGAPGEGPGTTARCQVLLGVCRALLHLHTRLPRIVHGDLKSKNVMVEVLGEDVHPKLLDFGLASVLTRASRGPLGGTAAWIAPEVRCGGGPARCSADIYSLGRLITFVATGEGPPRADARQRRGRRAPAAEPPLPAWPPGCVFEPACRPLVEGALRADPAARPSIVEITESLLGLPECLGLAETRGGFVREARLVAAQAAARSDGDAGDPPPSEPQPGAATSDAETDVPTSSGRLPSLPEAEAVLGAPAPERERHHSRPSRVRRAPALLLTSPQAMQLTVLEAIVRWNFEHPLDSCCEYHAGVKLAKEVCRQLASCRCVAPMQHSSTQCPHCGLLGLELNDGLCAACDEPVEPVSGAAGSAAARPTQSKQAL